jgi:hypothetical protein
MKLLGEMSYFEIMRLLILLLLLLATLKFGLPLVRVEMDVITSPKKREK